MICRITDGDEPGRRAGRHAARPDAPRSARAGHDAERDEPVGPRVVPVRHQRRATRGAARPRSRTCAASSFPAKPDDPGSGQRPEVRQRLRVDQVAGSSRTAPRTRRRRSRARRPRGPPINLGTERPAVARTRSRASTAVRASPKLWIRSREERDRAGEDEHRCLQHGSRPEDGQADADRVDAVPRSDDRAINKSVRMPVPMIVLVLAVSAGRILSPISTDRRGRRRWRCSPSC